MATSNILQTLEAGSGLGASNRSQYETYLASGTAAIAVGDWLSFDMSKTAVGDKLLYVLGADTDVLATKGQAVVGVAVEALTADEATAGKRVKVCISGIAEANCHADVTPGLGLIISGEIGQAIIATTGALTPIIGYAIDDAGDGGVVTCYVVKQF
jgi:hypothetical protein